MPKRLEMELTKIPRLINDSIVVETPKNIFVYSHLFKKIAVLEGLRNDVFESLKTQGFFNSTLELEKNKSQVEPPRNMMLLLGRKCMMGCKYCYADAGKSAEMMTVDIAEEALNYYLNTKPTKKRIVFHGGGEPSLNQSVIKHLLDKYENFGIRWNITTSGVINPKFLDYLISKGVGITISYDGNPEFQDQLRPLKSGLGSSALVEKTIGTLQRRAKSVAIRSTLVQESCLKIDEILEYSEHLGVSSIHMEALYDLGRAIDNKNLLKHPNIDERVHATVSALRWAQKMDKTVRVSSLAYFLHPGYKAFCGPTSGQTLVITHGGRLTACSEVLDETCDYWPFFHIGEIGNVDGEKLSLLANRNTLTMPACEHCFAALVCRGGCPHKGISGSGDFFTPDEQHCEFLRRMIPILVIKLATGKFHELRGGETG